MMSTSLLQNIVGYANLLFADEIVQESHISERDGLDERKEILERWIDAVLNCPPSRFEFPVVLGIRKDIFGGREHTRTRR